MNKIYRIGLLATISMLMTEQGYCATILPMYNYDLPRNIIADGAKLYQGVDVNTVNGKLLINSTNTIFFEPQVANVIAKDFSVSIAANCPAVKLEMDSEASLAKTKNNLIKLLEPNQINLNKMVTDQVTAAGTCKEKSEIEASKKALLDDKKNELIEAKSDLETARNNLSTCKLINPDNCQGEAQDVVNAAVKLQDTTKEINQISREYTVIRQEAATVCANSKKLLTNIEELTRSINNIRLLISDIDNSVSEKIISMGKEYGGTAVAVISNQSSEMQRKLQSLNPNYFFKPLQLKNAMFHFLADVQDNNQEINRRTVLGVSVQGAKSESGLDATSANTVMTGNGSVGVLVTMSRLGACSEKLTRVGGFHYSFNSYGYLKGSVKYNKWQSYKKIESTTKNNGFFTSKTVHSIKHDIDAGQGFDVAVVTDDPTIDTNAMREEIKQQFLSEMLDSWTKATEIQLDEKVMSMPTPEKHGAQVVGDGIIKYCPYIYCKAGGFFLKSLDSIFGKDVSVDEVKKSWNVTITEDFGSTRAYNYYGTTSSQISWLLN